MQIAVFKLFMEDTFRIIKGISTQLNMYTVKILKSKVILLGVIPNKFYCFFRRNTEKSLPAVWILQAYALFLMLILGRSVFMFKLISRYIREMLSKKSRMTVII